MKQKEALVDKIDSYLNYVVESWMEENKLAIEQGLRTEIAENFMNNLKNLFVESYIEVPESKVDLVDDLVEQLQEAENKLDRMIEVNIELNENVESLKRASIIAEASRDLASTQASKLSKLAEGIEFVDENDFIEKVETIRESYFSSTSTVSQRTLTEDLEEEKKKFKALLIL
jgi:hypothetical protein